MFIWMSDSGIKIAKSFSPVADSRIMTMTHASGLDLSSISSEKSPNARKSNFLKSNHSYEPQSVLYRRFFVCTGPLSPRYSLKDNAGPTDGNADAVSELEGQSC